MGSYTVTAYPTKVSIEPTNATVTNRDNIFDANDSTYGVIDVKSNNYSDFMITGFDFSSIPAGATINSVKLECLAKVENSSNVNVHVIACRKYTDGSYESQGTDYNEVWFNNTSVAVNTFSGTRIGTWTRDELASWSSKTPDDPYTGIAFYIRIKNSYILGARSATIYYFKVVVSYTVPAITYTYVDYDGTVLKTQDVEEGTSPTPPSNPTRPATAEYDYTFSGWSLSGTTYTAQYTATKREYLIRVLISPEEGGEPMLREYFWEYGTETHLVVVPNPGYKFVGWDDGTFGEIIDLYPNGTGFKKNIVVTGARDYIAYFEPVYVTFDSIFNFNKWKTNGITAGNGTISDITDTGFTLTSNSGVNEGTASSPYFPVEYGKSYKIDIDITTLTPTGGSDWDIYIFFCDEDGNWIDFVDGVSNRYSEDFNNTERIFTAPNKPEVVKAQIRCDANGSSNAVSFSNFRIYPAECEYMSTTVAAEDRSNAISWDIPTPVRNGYEFIGWNTEPDGGGDAYTSASAFPPDDLTLYSQWKAVDISKIYIGAKKVTAVYIGTQKVSVYCGTKKLS